MAQALIRNLDDALLADYRSAAAQNQRSLEAELRLALERARPMTPQRREALLALSRRLREMTPADVVQTPAEQIVRRMRDAVEAE